MNTFLTSTEAESEIENVLSHLVDNDPLVVSNLVFKIDDSLIFKIGIEKLTQPQNFIVQLSLIAAIIIVLKSIIL